MPHQACSVKVGLQSAPAPDITGPAVEASSQGVGMTNVDLDGTDTCMGETDEVSQMHSHDSPLESEPEEPGGSCGPIQNDLFSFNFMFTNYISSPLFHC